VIIEGLAGKSMVMKKKIEASFNYKCIFCCPCGVYQMTPFFFY